VVNVKQCLSANKHWRPGGALFAPKVEFKVGMIMTEASISLRELVKAVGFCILDLSEMPGVYSSP
jgi:hypothetical protein